VAHPVYYPLGTFPRLIRLERETDHSLPSSAEVSNTRSYTFIPPCVFMGWWYVKHRDNFTFTLPLPVGVCSECCWQNLIVVCFNLIQKLLYINIISNFVSFLRKAHCIKVLFVMYLKYTV